MNLKTTTAWFATDARTECLPARLGVTARRTYPDGAYTLAFVDMWDYEPKVSIDLYDADGHHLASSTDTQEWPTLQAYLPRAEWPREIDAGQKAPADHDATPDLRALLDRAIAELREGLDD